MSHRSTLVLPLLPLFLSVAVAAATLCPDTNFSTTTSCMCKAGTFKQVTPGQRNTVHCEPCPAGTFRAEAGALHIEQCELCPPGRFQRTPGSIRCFKCRAGTWSAPGSCLCATCPPGTEHISTQIYGCRRRFRDLSPACSPCPAGHISTFIAPNYRKCVRCLSDEPLVGDDPAQCKECPRNRFFSERCLVPLGKRVPGFSAPCPLGSISNRNVGCQICSSMTYQGRYFNNRCDRCRLGTHSFGPGAAACKDSVRSCPSNTYEDKDGVCKACLPGERFVPKSKKCIPCKAHQFSEGGVSTKCSSCPKGKEVMDFSTARQFERTSCWCKPGTVDDGEGGCVNCPPGTAWQIGDRRYVTGGIVRPDAGRCVPCRSGLFARRPKSLKCELCPADTVSNEKRTGCTPCPSGYKSPVHIRGPIEDSRICLGKDFCPPGFKRTDGVSDGRCVQEKCGPNEFRRGDQCITCHITTRYDPTRREDKCVNCPFRQISDGGTSMTCRRCPRGQLPGDEFNSNCVCRPGFGLVKGKCRRCPAGTISRPFGIPIWTRKCIKCPPGRFFPIPGAVGLHGACRYCPGGSTTPASGGASACTPCPPGLTVFQKLDLELENICREPFPPSK